MAINRTRGICISIFALALLLRVGLNMVKTEFIFREPFFLSGEDYSNSIDSDSVWYDGAARALINGRGMSLDENAIRRHFYSLLNFPSWLHLKKIDANYYVHKVIPPSYPVFLVMCYSILGLNTLAYFIPQAILGSLTCLIIYLIAKEIFNEWTAVLAAFAAALYPDLIFWTYLVRVETLFIFLISLFFLLLVKANGKKSAGLVYASAVVLGLASLTRVTSILFIPVFFIWELFNFGRGLRDNIKVSATALMLALIVLVPWCARNYLVFNEFTPFTEEINIAIIGVGPDAEKLAEGEAYYKLHRSVEMRIAAYIRDHFRERILLSAKNMITFWSPYTPSMRHFAKVYKTAVWAVIFPLALWGIYLSFMERRKNGLLIIAFIFYYALLHSLSGVDTGLVYRYPIQPFLCIFAAHGAWAVYTKQKT
jgi:4-amino-4-deoxy-L-arabinose transferase-like glycosyltransferase